jgi:hypothetical protein
MNSQLQDVSYVSAVTVPEDTMCYEFDELYWQDRAEQARKAMEKVKESKQAGTAVPARPASPEKETEVKVPVPA